jgi:argininosuccinate synthase
MAELIYNGLWFSPLRRALQAFVDTALQVATGEVTVELHRGHAHAIARTSSQTLYQPALASFDMTGYDARHAEGFIRLFGLPLAAAARRGMAGRVAPHDDAAGNGGSVAPEPTVVEVSHGG